MDKRNHNQTNLAESCQMDLIGSYTIRKQSKLITAAYPSEAVTSFVSLLRRQDRRHSFLAHCARFCAGTRDLTFRGKLQK